MGQWLSELTFNQVMCLIVLAVGGTVAIIKAVRGDKL